MKIPPLAALLLAWAAPLPAAEAPPPRPNIVFILVDDLPYAGKLLHINAGARLLIVETLVAEAPGPHFGKTLDIIMLAVTGGRERTRTQHAALLSAAGFELTRVLPTASQYSIVEAVAT